ncbi:TldD/PmbA family protein [Pseudomonas abieticivorans]|uniref:TldD/PmbA family protein n=1 Tax=Pseudomonas abieticivorans TaxID=2931382 RepID=UPI0020BF017F|nr:metallopeptidase TldD-related protein [Pseudomonas sp. PIA16]
MNHAHFSSAFAAIQQWVSAQLREGEQFSLWFAAEDSQFIRFNHGQVRQASQVRQIDVTLRLIRDERHASQHLNVSGVIEHDVPALAEGLAQLRALLDVLPADPYLELNNQAWHSNREASAQLPEASDLIEHVTRLSDGLDMVGIYAGGPMYRGFASSWGARGWHQAGSASLDFSLFQANGEAVKSTYAASVWSSEQLEQQFAQAREQLLHLDKPRKELPPGQYRAYLAPAAVEEIIGMLNWDGFSARALATRQSSLQALQLKRSSLSPLVSLSEMASTGLEPAFNTEGGLRQDQALLEQGQLVGQMVSTRSAREYGLTDNGASHYEHAASLEMTAGNLPSDEILATLGTGLYIGNLWYLNYSDMGSARMTGMTRFASFWVEDGKIVAPLATMRFDDSLYHMLGDNLLALTRERSLSISTSTYGQRSAQTLLLPGALIDRFTLTL